MLDGLAEGEVDGSELGFADGDPLGDAEGVALGLGLGTGESVGLMEGVLVGIGVPVGFPVGTAEGLGLGTGESVGAMVGAVGAMDTLGDADGGTSISSVLTPNPVSFRAPRDGPTSINVRIIAFNLIFACASNQNWNFDVLLVRTVNKS